MLTKNDLNKIGEAIDIRLKPVKSDLAKIGQVIDERLEIKLTQKLAPIKKDLKILRRDLESVLGSLDKDRWKLEQKFESHTDHPPRMFVERTKQLASL